MFGCAEITIGSIEYGKGLPRTWGVTLMKSLNIRMAVFEESDT